MKTISTFIIAILFFSIESFCQKDLLADDNSLQKELYNYLVKHTNILNERCLNSSSYLKFIINGKGEIDSLNFTYGTPFSVRQAITEACHSTKGKWLHSSFVQKEFYLLPLIFKILNGCKEDDRPIDCSLNILIDENNPKAASPKIPGSLKVEPLKCTILNPFFVYNN